jgi:hypothetical protein
VKHLILRGSGWAVLQLIFSVVAYPASSPQGPLAVQNYHPLQGVFLSLPTERAETLPKNRLKIDLGFIESNTLNINSNSPDIFILLDLEMSRLDLILTYGITETLEVGVEIPFLWRHGGFLDPFIEGVEGLVGATFPARDRRPQNIVDFSVVRTTDGTSLEFTKGDSGLGDILLKGKFQLAKENPGHWGIAVRAALKLPTGDETRVFGSGHLDFGMGTVFQKSLGHFTLYGDMNLIFPGGSFEPFDWDLRPIFSFGFAGEYRWTPRFSLLTQLGFHTTPFQDTGATSLDHGNALELTAGFSYRIRKDLVWKLGGVENLNRPQSTPDFSVVSSLSFELTPGGQKVNRN